MQQPVPRKKFHLAYFSTLSEAQARELAQAGILLGLFLFSADICTASSYFLLVPFAYDICKRSFPGVALKQWPLGFCTLSFVLHNTKATCPYLFILSLGHSFILSFIHFLLLYLEYKLFSYLKNLLQGSCSGHHLSWTEKCLKAQ